MTRHPVLRPGDTLRLGGATHTVAGCDSATVRLADVTGAVTEVPTAALVVAYGTSGCQVLHYPDNCRAFDYRSLWSTTLQTQLGAYFG